MPREKKISARDKEDKHGNYPHCSSAMQKTIIRFLISNKQNYQTSLRTGLMVFRSLGNKRKQTEIKGN